MSAASGSGDTRAHSERVPNLLRPDRRSTRSLVFWPSCARFRLASGACETINRRAAWMRALLGSGSRAARAGDACESHRNARRLRAELIL